MRHPLLAAVALAAASVPAGASWAAPSRAQAADWTWPVRGEVITRYRNGDDPYAGGQHRGIDVAARVGTPVVAAAGGTVRFAGLAGSSGRTVSIRAGRYDTSYLHLDSAAVARGDTVRAGQRVGAVGVSGRRSAARPHLHFGVRLAGARHAYVDPLDLLSRPPAPPAEPPAPRGVPVAAPRPALPARSPVPAAGRPAPALRALPAAGPLRVPSPAPSPLHAPAGRAAPGQPAVQPVPRSGDAPRSAARRPSLGSAPPVGLQAVDSSRIVGRPPVPIATGGLDLGWLAACAGLALAALALGRRERGRAFARSGSRALAVLARPLPGRG